MTGERKPKSYNKLVNRPARDTLSLSQSFEACESNNQSMATIQTQMDRRKTSCMPPASCLRGGLMPSTLAQSGGGRRSPSRAHRLIYRLLMEDKASSGQQYSVSRGELSTRDWLGFHTDFYSGSTQQLPGASLAVGTS